VLFSLALAWWYGVSSSLTCPPGLHGGDDRGGSAMFGPAYSAILPGLVGRADLPGASPLKFAQMNASRVIGPVIARWPIRSFGPSWVFVGKRGDLPLRRGRAHDVVLPVLPQGRGPGQPVAGVDGRNHRGPGGQGGRSMPGHRLPLLAPGSGVHRPDAGRLPPTTWASTPNRPTTGSSTPASALARSSVRYPSARSLPGPQRP